MHLEPGYAYAMGDFSTVYPEELGTLRIRRHFLATKDFQVICDDVSGEQAHEYTWLQHADDPFTEAAANRFVTATGTAQLGIHVLAPAGVKNAADVAMCFQKGSPNEGIEEPHGYQLALTTDGAVRQARFLVVLVPQERTQAPAAVEAVTQDERELAFTLAWPDGRRQQVRLDLQWQPPAQDAPGSGPLAFK